MRNFRQYKAQIKHGILIFVYQFIDKSQTVLSTTEPSQFRKIMSEDKRLSLYEAYYIAHALANRSFILEHLSGGQTSYALVVLLHFLTEDSVELKTISKFDKPMIHIYGEGKATIDQAFNYYMSIDFWVCSRLEDFVAHLMKDCALLFERPFLAPNEEGKNKLRNEFPEICQELSIENA